MIGFCVNTFSLEEAGVFIFSQKFGDMTPRKIKIYKDENEGLWQVERNTKIEGKVNGFYGDEAEVFVMFLNLPNTENFKREYFPSMPHSEI